MEAYILTYLLTNLYARILLLLNPPFGAYYIRTEQRTDLQNNQSTKLEFHQE